MRRAVLKLPHPLTVLAWIAALGIVVLFCMTIYWALFVPGDTERAMLCPKHEERIQVYGQLEQLKPLRAYQQRQLQKSRDYVEQWCQ
jgi:hypothetical protein